MPPGDMALLVDDLLKAACPLVVTSYLGRKPSAVGELVRLCRRLGVGVLESVPKSVNFPADDPLYLGNTWSEPRQNVALTGGPVLVLDSDVPWIPVLSRPSRAARIYHIDVDPLKERRPFGTFALSELSAPTSARPCNKSMNAWIDRR